MKILYKFRCSAFTLSVLIYLLSLALVGAAPGLSGASPSTSHYGTLQQSRLPRTPVKRLVLEQNGTNAMESTAQAASLSFWDSVFSFFVGKPKVKYFYTPPELIGETVSDAEQLKDKLKPVVDVNPNFRLCELTAHVASLHYKFSTFQSMEKMIQLWETKCLSLVTSDPAKSDPTIPSAFSVRDLLNQDRPNSIISSQQERQERSLEKARISQLRVMPQSLHSSSQGVNQQPRKKQFKAQVFKSATASLETISQINDTILFDLAMRCYDVAIYLSIEDYVTVRYDAEPQLDASITPKISQMLLEAYEDGYDDNINRPLIISGGVNGDSDNLAEHEDLNEEDVDEDGEEPHQQKENERGQNWLQVRTTPLNLLWKRSTMQYFRKCMREGDETTNLGERSSAKKNSVLFSTTTAGNDEVVKDKGDLQTQALHSATDRWRTLIQPLKRKI